MAKRGGRKRGKKKDRQKKDYFGFILCSVLIAVLFISLGFDVRLVAAATSLQNSAVNWPMLALTWLGSTTVIALVVLAVFVLRKRPLALPLLLSFVINAVVAIALKLTAHRLRPFQALSAIDLTAPAILIKEAYATWDWSFPSAHAAFVFACLPFISKAWPRARYWWLLFAAVVALSRVYFGLHYVSDVAAGALLGYLISSVVLWIKEKKKKEREGKKR